MSWNKIFLVCIAIVMISCAKSIINIHNPNYETNTEINAYLMALHDENNQNNDIAIDRYYNLYQKYNDEFYFNKAIILAMKVQNQKLVSMLNKNPHNEISIVIDTKINQNNKSKSYLNLKDLSFKYKKEFYLYKTISFCNDEWKDLSINTMCSNDKDKLLGENDFKNLEPIFYDAEYKNYSYPKLLLSLLEFDKKYNNLKYKDDLLKNINIDKLNCSNDMNECLSMLEILHTQDKYDLFFDLAQKCKNNLSYDFKNFMDTMQFNAFYFKLLAKDKTNAFNFLKKYYVGYQDIDILKYSKYLENNDFKSFVGSLELGNDVEKYNFLYFIFLQKYISNQLSDNMFSLLDNVVVYGDGASFDSLKYYLTMYFNDDLNKIKNYFFSKIKLSKNNAFLSFKQGLDFFYKQDCKSALNAIKDIENKKYFNEEEYQIILDEYSFGVEQLQELFENCAKER